MSFACEEVCPHEAGDEMVTAVSVTDHPEVSALASNTKDLLLQSFTNVTPSTALFQSGNTAGYTENSSQISGLH